jgi:bla regulator protein blaR1
MDWEQLWGLGCLNKQDLQERHPIDLFRRIRGLMVRSFRLGRIAATVFTLLGPGVHAQLLHPAGGAAPQFEVATVKDAHGAGQVYSLRFQPDRFIAEDAPLDRLIRFAYDVKSDRQVVNMPGWAGSEKFDIDAKIGDADIESIKKLPPDQGFQQYRLMVQSLLVDRFQMRVKTETQELPVCALVVMKSGPKLTPSAKLPDTQKLQLPQLHFTAAGDLKAAYVSMAFFAGWLSGRPDTGDRIVIDETGLKGSYDFALEWNPVLNGSTLGAANSSQQQDNSEPKLGDKPPLLTAIQEQLGLRIEPRKAPIEVLVIDHIEQPSAN